jgi:DNA-binding LytR/AlgR family response regulator
MNKIRVVIVEDEFPIAEDIRLRLEQNDYEVLSVFDRAETALPFMHQNSPDILLADIKLLGKADGISMVEELQQQLKLPVIYITANSDRATYDRAKRTNPHAFLIKPFSTVNLLAAIDLALHNFSAGQSPQDISRNTGAIHPHADEQFLVNQCLFIRTNGKYKKIMSDSILYIEASGSYIHLQTHCERFTLAQNLSQFQRKTPLADFVRVHRSYIVNINKVDSFEESYLFIQNFKLPISDFYRKDFLSRIHCL